MRLFNLTSLFRYVTLKAEVGNEKAHIFIRFGSNGITTMYCLDSIMQARKRESFIGDLVTNGYTRYCVCDCDV